MSERVDPLLPAWAIPYIPDFRRVARAIHLADAFMLIPVELSGPDVARALARWLEASGHPVHVIQPFSEDEWRNLVATLFDAKPHADGAVLLIGPRDVPPGLLSGLRLLNQRRDSVARHLQRPLLRCGPEEFLDTTWRAAPDLWSVADVPRRLEPSLEAPQIVASREIVIDKSGVRSRSPGEFEELYKAAKTQVDPRNAARLGLMLAEAQFFHDDYRAAEATARDVLALLHDIQEPRFEGAVHDLLGRLRMAQGALHEAAAELNAALAGFQTADDSYHRAKTLGAAGAVHEATGRPHEALACYEEARAIFRQFQDSSGEASMLVAAGRVAATLGDLERAQVLYEQALAMQEQLGNEVGIAGTYFQLGRIAEDRRDLDAAEIWYSKALTVSDKFGDQHSVARTSARLGWIAQHRRDHVAAERWYRKALALNEQIGNDLGAAEGYLALGWLAEEKNDFDAAETSFRKALSTMERIGNDRGIAVAHLYLGGFAGKRKLFDDAARHLLEARTRFAALGAASTVRAILDLLANLYKAAPADQQAELAALYQAAGLSDLPGLLEQKKQP